MLSAGYGSSLPQPAAGPSSVGPVQRDGGKPAGQDEEGERGSERDDSGADERALAQALDEGPVGGVDDRRLGARRRVSRYLEGGGR